MAYDPTKLVSLKNLKDTATRIKTEFLAAIAASGHAIFQKADAVPTPETAQENILYLVKNNDTGYYAIYALVDGAVEWLDDLSVDLDDYVTSIQLPYLEFFLWHNFFYNNIRHKLFSYFYNQILLHHLIFPQLSHL